MTLYPARLVLRHFIHLTVGFALALGEAASVHAAPAGAPTDVPAPPTSAALATADTPPASAELRARNQQLRERMERGERMMIGGRIGAGVAVGVFGLPGIATLVVGAKLRSLGF